MKKKALMEFIEVVESKAVSSVNTRHNKIISDAKEKLFETGGYNKRIVDIQNLTNSLQIEIQKLVLDMSDNVGVNYPRCEYNDLLHELNDFIGTKKIKQQMFNRSSFSGSLVPLLIKAKDLEIEEVRKNYNLVRYVCNNKSSAKDIAEYLEGVGFDISSVRKGDDCIALSVKLDKSKLFVCGDNK